MGFPVHMPGSPSPGSSAPAVVLATCVRPVSDHREIPNKYDSRSLSGWLFVLGLHATFVSSIEDGTNIALTVLFCSLTMPDTNLKSREIVLSQCQMLQRKIRLYT